jgi:hypothetical protein
VTDRQRDIVAASAIIAISQNSDLRNRLRGSLALAFGAITRWPTARFSTAASAAEQLPAQM